MEIELVGIVGAGQMGNGIAHVFALAGYDVLERHFRRGLEKALATIEKNIERQVSRGKCCPPTSARPWSASRPR
jgi:3-hydroxybutyryl-CoA dehydrogenase